MSLSIHSPDELIAVIPHMLGFKPDESIVFVPIRSDLPTARIDLPTTPRAQKLAWRSIREECLATRSQALPSASSASLPTGSGPTW